MALLSSTQQKFKRVPLTVSISESLLKEIKGYCGWAGINRPTEFFIQAMDYILKNDKEGRKVWAQQLNQQATENPQE